MTKPFFAREIYINGKKVEIPIQLGGMAVRIGGHRLAAAVANEGGVGIIGASGMHPKELRSEIKKAKELTNGIIGVNIMVPMEEFKELVEVCIEEKADLLVFAGGIPQSREYTRDITKRIPSFLIVSDPRHIRLASGRLGFAGAILESGRAGGHLGTGENVSLRDILPEAAIVVNKIWETKPDFIFVVAGGVSDAADVLWALQFADMVQIGSRFAVTVESNAHDNWKNLMVRTTEEDLAIIDSPVGTMKFRAVKTPFVEKLLAGDISPLTDDFKERKCRKCFSEEVCTRNYCIFIRLALAQKGNIEEGLFTISPVVSKITKIQTAKEVISDLMSGLAAQQGAFI